MKSFIDFQKEELELDEATVKTQKYSWGTMKTVHQGSDFSIPLHPEHHQEIAKLKDQQEHKFKDETGHHWTAKRSGDDVHFKGANGGNSTTVKHSTMSEEAELEEDTKYTPRFEYRQKVQPNINKHLDDRKTAGAHTAITYHKQSDGSTHAKVQYRNISHTNSSGVGPIQHKHFSVNKDHSVTPIKINEEQLDEARGKVVASYIQKAKEAMKKKIDMKRKTAQLNDPNSAEKKIVKESDLDEEQLDELSPKVLGSYIKKASGEATKSREAEKHWDKNDSDERGLHYANKNHAEKREKGIKTAIDKSEKMADKGIRKAVGKLLNTEEVEQIDELSKDTLASYEKKSRVAAHKHALASELKGLAADPAGSYAHKMMADKRHAGWKVAVKKLHTEESDTPFDGPYKQSKGTVTDKSGAKHTPLSNVRSLARNAIEKMKQKMRMAHLSPEVRAEKLARNEELVGGQKKLDIDKDGKIEKSDLEVLRAKKLKEDVTTAAQKLKAALDRHTENAVAANRAGDHDAVKVHQGYANKIKTQLGKLAKNEEMEFDEEQIDEGSQLFDIGHVNDKTQRMTYKYTMADNAKHAIEKSKNKKGHTLLHVYNNEKGTFHDPVTGKRKGDQFEEVEIDEGHQIVATTKEGETFKSGIHPTKEKALSQYYKMSKSGNYKKIATIKTEEVEIDEEQIEERNKQNAIMRKTMDASRGAKFKARNDTTTPDAEPQHKTTQAHNKAIGRAIRQMSNEEVEIDEASMTDAEMAKREKIVKGMKKSFKDFTAKYGDRAKEVEMAEGRMSQQHPLEGHPYHSKSDAELLHISKDAHAAAEAMKDHNTSAENKYRDQANDSATVRHFRKTHGTADWYKKKYALKKAMEEEVEEELEEDMDEGVTTRNGAVTVHKGTYGTSYQPNDDEDDEDTPEKKEPAVKRGRGRPAGAKSGAKPKGSSAGKSYGGVAIHSLRLPNNNK